MVTFYSCGILLRHFATGKALSVVDSRKYKKHIAALEVDEGSDDDIDDYMDRNYS